MRVVSGAKSLPSQRSRICTAAASSNGNGVSPSQASEALPTNKSNTDYLTTNTGTRVSNNDHSLTVGPRGPTLLEDYHLIEKMQQFD
jgi:hypothetical protein